jgi:DNA-binding NtrC family response regulator
VRPCHAPPGDTLGARAARFGVYASTIATDNQDRARRSCNFAGVMHAAARVLQVLVVDDEPLIRWSIAETLGAAGHQVREAQDAASALDAIGATPDLDLVLLDFRLPDSNDLGLLAKIRQLAPRAHVILMTAFGTADVTAGALSLGALKVLNKPFDMRELEDVARAL